MSITEQVLKKYISPCFLETGSYKGTTVQLAIDMRFEKVISIELSSFLYNICVEKFKSNKKVELYCGDVELILWDIINPINTQITFWLDAHYSGGGTAKGRIDDPIIEELEIIGRHNIKNHIIIIDDMRLMNKELVLKSLKKINEKYNFLFEDGYIKNDILVAKT